MPTALTPHPLLAGAADPVTKARLLAALLPHPMTALDLDRWVRRNDAADALDELLAAGSVRRTTTGGLALIPGRQRTALAGLQRDLQL
jgi:hypothetical protein